MRRRRRRIMMTMSRRWRGRGGKVEDSLLVDEGMLVKFPSVPFATCLLLFTKKKLNNYIVEFHKDPKS